jgi:sec-independent protein translocase protein TatA
MPFVGPWEVALILVVVLILFGPKKLPELAKSVGDAIRQYRTATETPFTQLTQTIAAPVKTEPAPTVARSDEQLLVETAKKLGISTEGKTAEQISNEIVEASKKKAET